MGFDWIRFIVLRSWYDGDCLHAISAFKFDSDVVKYAESSIFVPKYYKILSVEDDKYYTVEEFIKEFKE